MVFRVTKKQGYVSKSTNENKEFRNPSCFESEKLSNKQLKMIYAKIHIIALKYDGVISKEEIKNKLKVKLKIQSLSDLTRKQANQAIKVLIGWEI
ncbi:hypothetical protein P4483_29345 [Bacillus thuringiensis]|uniref:hypothetical protein n=1 Tax=Bacillus thuringiensis TaxID=1428 RepID=UPI000D6BB5FD|nr:hypothetical protein [Bacillus thuringiensis]MED3447957.1 hypothetical protein [Bacillus thuringiensis]PWN16729.1 hypothetical protein CU072_05235 [Bacillus thuringiensis]